MSELAPTGTITLIFTDIEGSTRQWESHPEAMRDALRRHDDLLRTAISQHRGYVFKTIGDAFCAAFGDADDAVAAVLAMQLALAAESWPDGIELKVRAALNTGEAEFRDNDYFGQCLNRVARMLAAAHGGQTIISGTTEALVTKPLPLGATVQDLGEHRLRDLLRAEHIFQLNHPSLPSHFAELKSLQSVPNNLPQQLTTFVGREQELNDLRERLTDSRLVTLAGSGGCGKSRIGIQVAADALQSFPGGAWLVELAPLTNPDLIVPTVLNVLGVRPEAGTPDMDALIDHLRTRTTLLILDNCEHLLDAVAVLIESILMHTKQVRVIASSREPIGIAGEFVLRIPSLSLPSADRRVTAEAILGSEAGRLFAERATTVQSSFEVTAENAACVAQLCIRLDGIPLAIELAAARVRTMSVENILQRLDDRFRLLTGGSRTALPRQQTLRALVDWSYNLLSLQEKTLLSRLSLFHGGWTLDAAEKICAIPPLEDFEILDFLSALVEKSLVQYEPAAGRYRMLETIRRYSQDHLMASDDGTQLHENHASYYRTLVVDKPPQWEMKTGATKIYAELEADLDNIRAALDWMEGARNPDLIDFLGHTFPLWEHRGRSQEALNRTETILRNDVFSEPAAKASILVMAGAFAARLDNFDLGIDYMQEAIPLRHAVDDPPWTIHTLYNYSDLLNRAGKPAEAKAALLELCEIAMKSRGNVPVMVLNNLAQSKALLEDEDAPEAIHEALSKARARGFAHAIAETSVFSARYSRRRGRIEDSQAAIREAWTAALESGSRETMCLVIGGFIANLFDLEGYSVAASLCGVHDRIRQEDGTRVPPVFRTDHMKRVVGIRGKLGDERFMEAYSKGRTWPLDRVTQLIG